MTRLLWVAALAAAPLFQQSQRSLPNVVAPPGVDSLSAESCAGCHASEYTQWRTSRHAAARTNALFTTSYRREPDAWCVSCHAPLPGPDGSPLAQEGITCAVCHVRDGAILGTRAPSAAAEAAHPVRVVSELGQSSFCASCHQFDFPLHQRPAPDAGQVVTYSGEPMQDTFGEWQRSGTATPCQGCHVAPTDSGRDHRFQGGHTATAMAKALDLTVQLHGTEAMVTLRSRGVDHALPTGDPFRTLVVELCLDDACDHVVARTTFGRTFVRGPKSWRLATDTSVLPGDEGTPQRLELDPLLSPPRTWRLSYTFPASTFERQLRDDDLELELARGRVAPP